MYWLSLSPATISLLSSVIRHQRPNPEQNYSHQSNSLQCRSTLKLITNIRSGSYPMVTVWTPSCLVVLKQHCTVLFWHIQITMQTFTVYQCLISRPMCISDSIHSWDDCLWCCSGTSEQGMQTWLIKRNVAFPIWRCCLWVKPIVKIVRLPRKF